MPSPPQLANLVSWYKADTGVFQDTGGTTPATTTGQSVALWQDQSGAGNHILQATSANQPTYATGALNSLPSVNFVWTSKQYLVTSGSATLGISTANWWIAAVYVTGPTFRIWGGLWQSSSGANGISIPGVSAVTPTINAYIAGSHAFADVLSANTAYWSEFGCTAGTLKCYHAPVGTTPAQDANTFTSVGAIANSAVYIGWDTTPNLHYFEGQICEILVYKTALNSTDQTSLENYLSSRYGGPYTFLAAGLAISGYYGGATAGASPSVAGLAISGAYGGAVFPGIISSAAGLAISGAPGGATAGPSPGVAGLAISGYPGVAVFPGIISPVAGMAISGAPGGATAGPSPGVAGLAITGGQGGAVFPGVTVLLAGLGISGGMGGAMRDIGPFYLPYEYTSVPIESDNTNPFGIDPERTTIITVGLTSAD